MKTIYTNFADMAKALGFTAKQNEKEETRECPKCGKEMEHVEGTNIWLCKWASLEETTFKDKDIQVFTPCGGSLFA